MKPKIVSNLIANISKTADSDSTEFSFKADNQNQNYKFIKRKFFNVGNRYEPLEKKTLRGNQAPFMTKELRKEIYTKSKLKIKYKRSPTEENKAICKKRNKYIYIYIKKSLSCISAM